MLFREAKDQFINLPLINTLRVSNRNPNLLSQQRQGGDEEGEEKQENQKPMDTVPQPPSFVYDDVQRW